jgi:hypothetical protein
MKTVIFCLMLLLFLGFPISGKTAILQNNAALRMQLSENGKNEDDPATDDGEDLRDGDSDSNSNDDSDKDDG